MLMLASVASMIDQFNMDNINILLHMGYEVDVACNFKNGSTCSDSRVECLKSKLCKLGVGYYQIDFTRNVLDIKNDIVAYRQLKKLVHKNKYEFIHCHSPIGGVLGRIAGHKENIKVIYTAHGFHFFKGSSLINWILYFPIEYFMSYWTDVLITINKEDYKRAKNILKAKKTYYIPGVGVYTKKFRDCKVNKYDKLNELGIDSSKFVMLSVGELHKRKNHMLVIKALEIINNDNLIYVIVGNGKLENKYKKYIDKHNLNDKVILLGNREDVHELCKCADVFIHPSVREGLGIAALEAMAGGLPLISSYVNGIKDYTKNGHTGCCINPKSIDSMVRAIRKMYSDEEFRKKCGKNNMKVVKKYDINNTNAIMQGIYKSMMIKKDRHIND